MLSYFSYWIFLIFIIIQCKYYYYMSDCCQWAAVIPYILQKWAKDRGMGLLYRRVDALTVVLKYMVHSQMGIPLMANDCPLSFFRQHHHIYQVPSADVSDSYTENTPISITFYSAWFHL